MGDYHISDIYQGGYSSLKEDYGPVFTGYRVDVSKLGISTDPRTANILKEVSEKITPGGKVIELSLIDLGEATASVPKQHLDEVRRLSKLTGVEVTVHGPITDASGITEQNVFSEHQRQTVERKLLQMIERSHAINPDGNIPVTFHTSNRLPGPTWEKTPDGKEEVILMPVVNRDTGQLTQVKKVEHFEPHLNEEGKVIKTYQDVNEQLRITNQTEWRTSIDQIEFNRERANQILREIHPVFVAKYVQHILARLDPNSLPPEEREQAKRLESANAYLREAQRSAQGLFDRASKAFEATKDEKAKERLKEVAKQYSDIIGVKGENQNNWDWGKYLNPLMQSEAIYALRMGLNREQPELYIPAEEYALEKTGDSYGNVAFQAWEKYGYKKDKDTTPIVLIENPPAGGALSRAKDLKNVINKAKDVFIEKAKGKGISEEEARKEADKLIGATWDVGHINQLRKYGFTGKDIIKEAETIAPLVKHVHLSDNFGMDNVELPMGMGNVDFKEVMQKLGKQGEEARKIVEAAHWWQFQQTNPIGVSMEALGSPIYGMKMAPYWNQTAGLQQGYFGGYGAFLPQINYETFGGGFSQLPLEFGGQRQQTGRSRMGGAPME